MRVLSMTVRGPGLSAAALRASSTAFERGVARLSSGLRITSAADDAAGLVLSEQLRSQVTGSAVAARNVHDGIGLLRTAEGGLEAITSMLQRARDLAVQSANAGALDDTARAALAAEVGSLVAEIDRAAGATAHNGQRLLNGDRPGGFAFQVGAASGDVLRVGSTDARASALGLLGGSASTVSSASVSTWHTRTDGDRDATFTTTGATTFTFAVGTSPSITLTLATGGTYTGVAAHEVLRGQLAQAMTTAGVAASVTLDSKTNQDKSRFVFTAHDPTQQVLVSGPGAGALDLAPPALSGTTTVFNSTPTPTASLEDLVASGSSDAIAVVDAALATVGAQRAETGALHNRLEHQLAVLASTGANLAAARSRIADADMAQEWASVVRAQLLSQTGTAVRAQASAGGQRVVQLLGSL